MGTPNLSPLPLMIWSHPHARMCPRRGEIHSHRQLFSPSFTSGQNWFDTTRQAGCAPRQGAEGGGRHNRMFRGARSLVCKMEAAKMSTIIVLLGH